LCRFRFDNRDAVSIKALMLGGREGRMALNAGIHWGLILRIDVAQTIARDGWKWLLKQARFPWNFDGEIFGLDARYRERLLEFGFRGPEAGLDADFVDVNQGFRSATETVGWLEMVDVLPLSDDQKCFKAWKLKGSEVYAVSTLDGCLVTKGYEVDWSPLIGKISG
jgi:hypothetical protein